MAKFYPVRLPVKWVKVTVIPLGIRRVGIGNFRPVSEFLPFQSQKPIKFLLLIEYGEEEENDDYREFRIRRVRVHSNGRTTAVIKEIHSEENKKKTLKVVISDWEEHDDGVLEYEIHFPRTSVARRLIYSKPMDSNFVPVAVLGGILGVIGIRLLVWLYALIAPIAIEAFKNLPR
jgi:hypothetical protein